MQITQHNLKNQQRFPFFQRNSNFLRATKPQVNKSINNDTPISLHKHWIFSAMWMGSLYMVIWLRNVGVGIGLWLWEYCFSRRAHDVDDIIKRKYYI